MQYQLPNGKVINLSIEEYLSLTDEDVQFLIAYNYGDTIIDPFLGSTIYSKEELKDYNFECIPDDLKEDDSEFKSNMNETDIDDSLDISY